MSKRYGITQKRNHLFKIAKLEKQIALLAAEKWAEVARANLFKDKLDKLIKCIQRVAKNSALLPPEVRLQPHFMPGYRLPILPKLELSHVDGVMDMPVALSVDLHPLEIFIRENPKEFQKVIHIIFRNDANNEVRYMISDEAMACLPAEMIFEYLSNSILDMIKELQSGMQGKKGKQGKKQGKFHPEPKEL
jgi:hypothetical protein